MVLSRSDQKCSQALPSLTIVLPGLLTPVLAALVTFHALFHGTIAVLHLYALYWCNTDFIHLFSAQLTSAQLEHTDFGLHSCPSSPQLLCLVVKLQSLLYIIRCCFSFGAFSLELPPALQRGTGIPYISEASLGLESKQETSSAAVQAVPW